jgi:acetylornithine deacetylase/succinyl-diaminopimelate desuccinylase-like protein
VTIKPGAIGTETAIPHPATKAGHAVNAQNADCARALVNCRIIPGEKFDDIKATLIHVLADDQFVVKQVGDANPSNPAVIDEELLATIEKTSAEFWPGVPVVPTMSAGATDGLFLRNAGIPTYGHSGLASDVDDVRAHGKDERVAAKSFFDGGEYLYRLVRRLSGGT